MSMKGFGVRVTIRDRDGAPRVQPLVVVARDERDAERVAAAAAGGDVDAETLRALTEDEVRDYGLDLGRHGDAKSLPALNF
jgi:hypothetical protein